MRWTHLGWTALLVLVPLLGALAEERPKTSDRVISGVLSGLLGEGQQPPDAAYAAKEQHRLVSLLQTGEYVTSRQHEPVDAMILGIPLTRQDHVYTAKPIQPNPFSSQDQR